MPIRDKTQLSITGITSGCTAENIHDMSVQISPIPLWLSIRCDFYKVITELSLLKSAVYTRLNKPDSICPPPGR